MTDEIERLRQELAEWQKIARYLYDSVSVLGKICPCETSKHWCGIHAFDDKVRGGFPHEKYNYD